MERYVWELTLQLRQLGHRVTVICERCHSNKPVGITVIELGEVAPRPRWIAALRFAHRVEAWLRGNPQPDSIIHSHERIYSHDITTFHGSVFATVKHKAWWHLISLRIPMQLFLEKRELSKPAYIVPNSQYIKQQLALYYPSVANKLTAAVTPGVAVVKARDFRSVPSDGGVVGFVGEEWKRKGLPLAVAIVRQLRLTRPNLEFFVVGPASASVKFLFSDWNSGFVLKEWDGQINYSEFDVLLHPAKSEPYGMVISEAMAARVPVVISDVCGSSVDVTPAAGSILSLDSSLDAWVNALEHQLSRTEPVPQFSRSWQKVAYEYEQVYRSFASQMNFISSDTAETQSVSLVADVVHSSVHISSPKAR
jgi:UDP-glucose:(heptosyl)LPS alpha-1,3-glucosyltransferase